MGQVKSLLNDFSKESHDCQNCIQRVLSKILYSDGSVESDLTALMQKSALLKKEGAVYKSLIQNKQSYETKMQGLLYDLDCLNQFLNYLVLRMPDRLFKIQNCIQETKVYLKMHQGPAL